MKIKEIIINNTFIFNKSQQDILLQAFKRKKYTPKLQSKIMNMDVNLLQKKLNKTGYELEIEITRRGIR